MELVDRYLHAVKFWLPSNQKDDIIAELSEDLRSQIEDKESELGHKLAGDEVESILKRCGSPMAVAGSYLPQRSLIGPALFPIYRMVIRALILYFLLPWLLLCIGTALFSPQFRAAHPGIQFLSTLGPWWLACTYSLFFNTLAFALLEHYQVGARLVSDWNPRTLPIIRDPNKTSRGTTVFELTMSVAGLALWFELGAFRRVFHIANLEVTLSPLWPYFFWALFVLSLGGILVACLNLLTPRWTRTSASLRLGLDCYSWVLVYLVMRSGLWQSLSGADLSSEHAAKLVSSINYWMSTTAISALVVGLVVMIFDVRRIIRVGKSA